MPQIRYRGDRTGAYRHSGGTGLVGKVLGPDLNGRWHVVISATYDGDADTTSALTQQIRQPAAALDANLRETP